jgi:hypothetical protein
MVTNKIEVDIVRKDGGIRHVQVFGKVVIREWEAARPDFL